ncbi:MAG TPA: hypothetical protein VIF83_06575 [Gemmatimonadaceae bacterium]
MTTPRPRPSEPLSVPVSRDSVIVESDRDRDAISIVEILSILLRYRVMIVGLALLVGFFAGIKSLMSPMLYSTEAEFMPKGTRAQSQLASLAQQVGLAVGGDAGQSPQFYMDLIKSRPVLNEVGSKQYTVRTDSGTVRGDILTLFNAKGLNAAERRSFVVELLQGMIATSTAPKTGVITLTVRTTRPDLSVQIAGNLLDQVNAFNLNTRQQQASAERVFLEKRLAEARGELRAAEENLQAFMLENRDLKSSPTLALEFNRLNRTVDMRQQLYTGLAQAYEQAKIEEVRDLPVITVVEPPEIPLMPDRRHTLRKVMIAMLLSVFAGVVLAFVRNSLAANKSAQPDAFHEYAELRRDAIQDLTHPWRPIRRLFSSQRPT